MDSSRLWPLTGRGPDLDTLCAALVAAGPGGVVVTGDAGVGKTRLLREAVARLAGHGAHHHWVAATRAAASIPLAAVSGLLPEKLPVDGNPLALLIAVSRQLPRRGRVIVGIDDAHLLDEPSAGLLQQLAARGLIVPALTVRSGEPVSDAFVSLWKEGVTRLHLQPLSRDAIAELIGFLLGGGLIDPISRNHLHRLAGGNPLLLREVMADAVESGDLAEREGVWVWQRNLVRGPRLAELVMARIHALDRDTQHVLEIVACGEPLALHVLERLAGSVAIENAERSGMAAGYENTQGQVTVRIIHPLYSEVLRAHLPASRARTIYSELAAALLDGATACSEAEVLTAGVWEVESGTIRRPDLVMASAEQAIARFDLVLAERLALAVRHASPGWDADWLLARILQYRGRSQEALDALPAAPPAGSRRWVMWAVTAASLNYWGLGKPAEAQRILSAAASGTPGHDMIEASRSWILFFDGRCRDALAAAETVLAQADVSDQATVWAAMAGAMSAGSLGQVRKAMAIAERGAAVASNAGALPWADAQVGYGTCHALLAAGDLHGAREVAEEGYASAIARNAGAATGLWAGFLGVIAKAGGDLARAQTHLRQAIALLDGKDEYEQVPVWLSEMAGAAALMGNQAEAIDWIARADARKTRCNRVYEPWIELNRAWVYAARGLLSHAADQAGYAAELARGTCQPAFEASALFDVARLGQPSRAAIRLQILAPQIDGAHGHTLAAAAAALAGNDIPALEQATRRFVHTGHCLHGAEMAAAASHAVHREGQQTRVGIAQQRAAALAAQCPGASTPLLRYTSATAGLTSREREIAILAAQLPSRRIAQQLGLSVNTVNNNLARAYTKLGITSRTELAAIFSPG